MARLFTQGMIRMDGTKMSKSKGNLISPQKYFDDVGADALRLFHLGVGPPAEAFDWTDQTDSVIDGLPEVPRPALAARHGPAADAGRPARRGRRRRCGAGVHQTDPGGHRRPRPVAVPHRGRPAPRAAGRDRARRSTRRPEGTARSSARRSTSCARCSRPMTPHVTAELWSRRHPGAPGVHQSAVADPRPRPAHDRLRDPRRPGRRQGQGPLRGGAGPHRGGGGLARALERAGGRRARGRRAEPRRRPSAPTRQHRPLARADGRPRRDDGHGRPRVVRPP